MGILDAEQVRDLLSAETIRIRDQIRRQAGEVLTVADTRAALDALPDILDGRGSLDKLSAHQQTLVRAWQAILASVIDRPAGQED